MKVWMLLAYFIISLASIFGYALPMLFSAKSTPLFLLGILALPVLGAVIFRATKFFIKNLQPKKEGSPNA